MVKISISEDLGNSPRKIFLRDFNIAFLEGDSAFVDGHIDNDISWHIVGNKRIQGRTDFMREFDQMKNNDAIELVIDTILTHGKGGTVNGEITMKNGMRYSFCDIYQFSSARSTRLKSIISYVMEMHE